MIERRWVRARRLALATPEGERRVPTEEGCALTLDGLVVEILESSAGALQRRLVAFRSESERDRFAAEYEAVRVDEGFVAVEVDAGDAGGPGSTDPRERVLSADLHPAAVHAAFGHLVERLPAAESEALVRAADRALLRGNEHFGFRAVWSGSRVVSLVFEHDDHYEVSDALPRFALPELRSLRTLRIEWRDRPEPPPLYDYRDEAASSDEDDHDRRLLWILEDVVGYDLRTLRELAIRSPEPYLADYAVLDRLPALEVLRLGQSGSSEDALLGLGAVGERLTWLDVAHAGGSARVATDAVRDALEDGRWRRLACLMVRGLEVGDAAPARLRPALEARGIRWAAWEPVTIEAPARTDPPEPVAARSDPIAPLRDLLDPYDLVEGELGIGPLRSDVGDPSPDVDPRDPVEARDLAIDDVERLADVQEMDIFEDDPPPYEDPILGWRIAIPDPRGGWSPDQVYEGD